jgi:UDP-glucose 4-epimerase
MLISAYTACYGVAGCALRFANVYGPGMHAKDSMIPRLMRAARDGGGVQVYGDGEQVRDFVHVDDVIQAMFLAWRTGQTGPLVVGSGVSNSVIDLVDAVRVVTGAPLPVTHVPAKPGEMPAVVLNPERLRGLGHKPSYDLKDGLATVWPDFGDGGGDK